MEVTLGCDEDDFLHVQLDASLLNVPEVAQVNDSGDGSWKHALQVRAHVCRIRSNTRRWSLRCSLTAVGSMFSRSAPIKRGSGPSPSRSCAWARWRHTYNCLSTGRALHRRVGRCDHRHAPPADGAACSLLVTTASKYASALRHSRNLVYCTNSELPRACSTDHLRMCPGGGIRRSKGKEACLVMDVFIMLLVLVMHVHMKPVHMKPVMTGGWRRRRPRSLLSWMPMPSTLLPSSRSA